MEKQRWGDYEIEEVLGKGGMGIVYRGRQVSLDRIVAIKVLPSSFTERKDFIQRFHREAKAVARINCPQIIQVYGAGEHEGKQYFAMEYIEGEDLGEKLKRNETFDISSALFYAKETARALAAAGEKNIIHRDIKPGNIMVTKRGTIKVMDFGLAKFTTEGTELTQAGVVMGTVNYLSPEQGQGKEVDQRTDIYSLGVVMYELVTGDVPFKGENPSSVIYQHIHTTPTPPSKRKSSIPSDIEAIIMKCLRKNPDERYFTARELVKDIEAIESGMTPRTVVADMMESKRRRVKRIVAAVFALLCIGGLGVAGWLGYEPYIKPLISKLVQGKKGEQDDQQDRNAEKERKRKELEIKLKALENQSATQDIQELEKIVSRLEALSADFPESRGVVLLGETIKEKITKIKRQKENITKVEELLDAKEFGQAETLAAKLYEENPEDLILANLFKRVQKEKNAHADELQKKEQIRKEVEAAEELLRMGSYKLAKKKFENVLFLDAKNEKALAGLAAAQKKIEEQKESGLDTERDPTGLTAAEQFAIAEYTNYYNQAEKFFQQKDYDNALMFVEKALNVDKLDHIPEAVQKKQKAVGLKIQIESRLSALQKEELRRKQIARLKKTASEKEYQGEELEAVRALEQLGRLDPDNAQKYSEKIRNLHKTHDTKASSACVKSFSSYVSSENLERVLSLIDKDSKEFYRSQEKDFREFFASFDNIISSFTIDSVNLSGDRQTCAVNGTWVISFSFTQGKKSIRSAVSYAANLSLVKKNQDWRIKGAETVKKRKGN